MRPRQHYHRDKRRYANGEEGSKKRRGGQRLSHQQSHALLLRAAIWRRACVAFGTRQQAAEGFGPAIGSDDPRPVAPWWMMPDMLMVAALELSHPVLLLVLVKSSDAALHAGPTRGQRDAAAPMAATVRRSWARWCSKWAT